ncbi:UNVERIFIED_CONTAM: hypothetical protein HDU68_009742 [Siphonaria sp. JEL0065]|nr:hypothetical protein HDU68_009742 [Siphonaria sp. JEL0065]
MPKNKIDDGKVTKKKKKILRAAGGEVWKDETMAEWDPRATGLSMNEVGDELLVRTFSKYPSFVKAKVVRDKKTTKSKGYGFTPEWQSVSVGVAIASAAKDSLRTCCHSEELCRLFLLAVLFLSFRYVSSREPLDERITASDGVHVSLVATGLAGARTIVYDQQGALLVVAPSLNLVVHLSSTDNKEYKKAAILDWTGLALNHGLALVANDSFLIGSSADAVYLWSYNGPNRIDLEETFTLVSNINGASNGKTGHVTRSLTFDETTGFLYVSIGSLSNVDANSDAARIVRFKIINDNGELDVPEEDGFDFVNDGEIWADGLRNSVAQAWDGNGRLWESNNGPDMLARHDLANGTSGDVDFHNDSPVEEINLLDEQGAFYGYPYCFTAGNVTLGFDSDPSRGRQWSWVKGGIDGKHDDDWCRNITNNKPPVAHIPAHSAPISMVFLKEGDGCDTIKGVSFPCSAVGNLILTLHGSWNRDIPTGYSVIMIPFVNGLPKPYGNQPNSIITLIEATDLQNKCGGTKSSNCFRPTGVSIVKERGTLVVSSDTTGEVVEISFDDKFGSLLRE